jgi:hypothetical protein
LTVGATRSGTLARRTAIAATPGLLLEALGAMKFLLAHGEDEAIAAVHAGKRFVGERHSTTSKII